jgi:glutamyl/glutaminyl-tRNA synthetase
VARGHGGTFVLRLEDTGSDRADVALEPGLIEDLAWLGLRWDEGPDLGGPCGPYRQSERAALTGRAHGLPVATLVALLGVDEWLRRTASALA